MFRNLLRNPSVTAVIALTVLSWSLIIGYRTSVPSAQDWERAAAYVRTARAVEDGFTWFPHYAEEGTRLFAGLNAFESTDDITPDFSRFERVWLLTSHGATPNKFPPYLVVEAVHEEGAITVWRVDNRGERVVADLYADLEEVVVQERDKAQCDFWSGVGWHCLAASKRKNTQSCLKESTAQRLSRFRRKRSAECGLSPWFHVSRDVRVIDRSARHCVWVHPKQRNPFVLNWTPRTRADELVVRYGFTDRVMSMHSRPKPRTQTARLEVEGLETAESIEINPVPGWFEKRWAINAQRTVDTLTFTVTTSSPVDAHFCMDVTLRKGGR